MSYAEFVEWQALYRIEPFGGVRDDLHMAMIVTMLANVNRNAKKRKSAYKLADFMPDWWKDKQDPSAAHAANLLAKFQMLTDDTPAEAPEEIEPSGAKHRDTIR